MLLDRKCDITHGIEHQECKTVHKYKGHFFLLSIFRKEIRARVGKKQLITMHCGVCNVCQSKILATIAERTEQEGNGNTLL